MKRYLIILKKNIFLLQKNANRQWNSHFDRKSKKCLKNIKNIKKSQSLCCKTFTRVLLTCRKHYTSDNLGKGLSFCISKHDIRCPRISSTENMASEGDFPSRISAANAIAKSPQL